MVHTEGVEQVGDRHQGVRDHQGLRGVQGSPILQRNALILAGKTPKGSPPARASSRWRTESEYSRWVTASRAWVATRGSGESAHTMQACSSSGRWLRRSSSCSQHTSASRHSATSDRVSDLGARISVCQVRLAQADSGA